MSTTMNTLNAAMPIVAISGMFSGTVPAGLMFQSMIAFWL